MKSIIILMGLKGSGKTYIGTSVEKLMNIKYLKIELIYLQIMESHPELQGLELEKLFYQTLLEYIHETMKFEDKIIIDSTGTSSVFHDFYTSLKNNYQVYVVLVKAPFDVCLKRVLTRETSGQIPLSQVKIEYINRAAEKITMKWDLIIDNSENAGVDHFLLKIKSLINSV